MTRDIPEVVAARRDLAEARRQAAADLARIEAELDTRPTPDGLRAAADTIWHMPRPDGCDCPEAPCGLTVVEPGCGLHRTAASTLKVGIHSSRRCPGGAT